ncbi:hypothetical protein ACI65C_000319 [Semiaphis heraclei]
MVLSVSVFSSRPHFQEKTPFERLGLVSLTRSLFNNFGASQNKRSPYYAILEVTTTVLNECRRQVETRILVRRRWRLASDVMTTTGRTVVRVTRMTNSDGRG